MEFSINILPLIAGVLLCLAGWTLYWTGVRISGGLFGGGFAGSIGIIIAKLLKLDSTAYLISIIFFTGVGAIAGIFIFKKIHSFVFFMFGSSLGILLAGFLKRFLESNEFYAFKNQGSVVLLNLILAFILGVLMIYFSKYIITTITSIAGTYLILFSIQFKYVEFIFFPLFTLSVIIQTGCLKYFKSDNEQEAED